MAEHAHSIPAPTLARRRLRRAAPGASDRRLPAAAGASALIIRMPVPDHDGYPFTLDAAPLQLRWTGTITPGLRQRIEQEIELGIAFLDALDAPAEDLEPDDEGCCDAEDQPIAGLHGLGDADDAEDGGDLEPTCEDIGEFTVDDYGQLSSRAEADGEPAGWGLFQGGYRCWARSESQA